jgi:hypothetical protein
MRYGTLAIIGIVFLLSLSAGAAESPRPLVSFFPELDGWRKVEKAELFQPETLYERIDGAAENFLGYGFQQLAVQSYGNDQKQFMSAEIYFHGTLENAFGIYSSEKPLTGSYLPIGGQGYAEDGVLNFFSDAYYVKLNSFGLGPEGNIVLAALAEKIARAIGGENTLPKILAAFPRPGKHVDSERFILTNFLGHGFLRSAYVADYRCDKQNFQLFIISAGSESDARAIIERYAALDKDKPGTDTFVQSRALVINDPYNGPVRLIWQGKFICGSNSLAPAAAGHIAALALSLAKQ